MNNYMNVLGTKWRHILLGSTNDIRELREIHMSDPDVDCLPVDEIDRDLTRTFPNTEFFTQHINDLRNILLWYAWTNQGYGYCQNFSFLSFVVYKVMHASDPNHAMIDTYYCMHRLVLIIKPMLPMSSQDDAPLHFIDCLRSVVVLDIMSLDYELFEHLKGREVVKYIIMKGFSTMFLNWFCLDECVHLLDFVIDEKNSTMFQRLISFLTAFLLVNREYFLHFDDAKVLELMTEKQLYVKFWAILMQARALESS